MNILSVRIYLSGKTRLAALAKAHQTTALHCGSLDKKARTVTVQKDLPNDPLFDTLVRLLDSRRSLTIREVTVTEELYNGSGNLPRDGEYAFDTKFGEVSLTTSMARLDGSTKIVLIRAANLAAALTGYRMYRGREVGECVLKW